MNAKRDISKWKTILGVTALFAVVLLPIIWVFSLSAEKGDKVESSIHSYKMINPSLLSVEYRVTNTTDWAGYATCSISMNDESYSYSGNGYGYESAKKIMPRETYSGIANVKISNDGASYITHGGIKCTIKKG